MLFAAGLGTRLKPLTDQCPKALVKVNGRPLIEYVLERLISFGATEVVVNVHHFSNMMYDYFNNTSYPITIKISDESDSLLDTGGGLKKAADLFTADDRPILIHNVDIFSNANLGKLYGEIGSEDALLLVSKRDTSRYLLFNERKELVAWKNVLTGETKTPYTDLDSSSLSRFAFSGIHVISTKLLKKMENYPEKFSIVDFYLKECSNHAIKYIKQDGLELIDVGKINALDRVGDFLVSQ